jgi:hypothetical protein
MGYMATMFAAAFVGYPAWLWFTDKTDHIN